MKTFKIAHLYYNLMNLYGEIGNILCLKDHLEHNNLKVEITNISLNEPINWEEYDLFYIGSGNEESFELVLEQLKQEQSAIKKAINNNKFFLVTGNALNLFGKTYTNKEGHTKKALGILAYDAYQTDFRIVGEQTYEFAKLEQKIIGFNNRDSVLKYVKEKHLFQVINGTGYVPKSIVEGIQKNNFYGTYLLGPLLIRNPEFTEYLVQKICNEIQVPYKEYHNEWEEKAYEEYQKNIVNQKN